MANIPAFISKVSNISEYVNTNDEILHDNLQDLTKLLYEYGQNEKSYKKSNKKSRNLSHNFLVTEDFGDDEIWTQIKDHSQTVLSTVDQRSKYRTNERQRMQQILNTLQNDIISDHETPQQNINQFIDDENQTDIDSDSSHTNSDTIQKDNNKNNNNDWIDIIQDHRTKQLTSPNKTDTKQEDTEEKQQILSDDELDFDEFKKQTDAMEAFINKQWETEKEMAEHGAFDLVNDNMFERALIYDEEMEDNAQHNNQSESTHTITTNKNKNKNKPTQNKSEVDDFAFLNKHIANDIDSNSDQDNNNNNKNNNKNDQWDQLFNLPKFSHTNTDINHQEKFDPQGTPLQNLSKFELEQQAIQQRIRKLEEENMKQRTWEYQGEVSNNKFTHPNAKRKPNSLLHTYLDFDYSDKLKPQITDDLNSAIENLIITKIKNDQFDDIERKRDFANAPSIAKRKLVEIQDTKSSMGLAELYEREYLQQIENKQELMNDEEFMSSKDMELSKQYSKISRLKSTLFYELDQLIRFHYEPKQAVITDNIKSKTHTHALYLEEMGVDVMTNAMTMTPEQLYRKPRKLGHIKGENEMSKQDRKNKRRANKKRAKYWKAMRNESDGLRAKYDEKFQRHLKRIDALNEVRRHAMAAAKKNGYLSGKNIMGVDRDQTRYTSSKQVFAKMEMDKQNKKRRLEKLENEGLQNESMPPEKKRKLKSMMQ